MIKKNLRRNFGDERFGNHVTVPWFFHRMIASADKGVLDTFVFILCPEIQVDIPLPVCLMVEKEWNFFISLAVWMTAWAVLTI